MNSKCLIWIVSILLLSIFISANIAAGQRASDLEQLFELSQDQVVEAFGVKIKVLQIFSNWADVTPSLKEFQPSINSQQETEPKVGIQVTTKAWNNNKLEDSVKIGLLMSPSNPTILASVPIETYDGEKESTPELIEALEIDTKNQKAKIKIANQQICLLKFHGEEKETYTRQKEIATLISNLSKQNSEVAQSQIDLLSKESSCINACRQLKGSCISIESKPYVFGKAPSQIWNAFLEYITNENFEYAYSESLPPSADLELPYLLSAIERGKMGLEVANCQQFGKTYKTCCSDFANSCISAECTDTDNGDYGKQGTTSFRDLLKTDECRDNKTLLEYSCNKDGGFSQETHECSENEKCDSGACVKKETECKHELEINAIRMFKENEEGIRDPWGHTWFCLSKDCGKTRPFISCTRMKELDATNLTGRCCYGFYPLKNGPINSIEFVLSIGKGDVSTLDIGEIPDKTKKLNITKDQFSKIVDGLIGAQNENYNVWGRGGYNCVTWMSRIINPILLEKGLRPIDVWTPDDLIKWIDGLPPDKEEKFSCGLKTSPSSRKLKEVNPEVLSPTAGLYYPTEGEHIFSSDWLGKTGASDMVRDAYGKIKYK